MTKGKFAHCHFDEETGLVWCRHHNGSWAPPFEVGPSGSSDEIHLIIDEDNKDQV